MEDGKDVPAPPLGLAAIKALMEDRAAAGWLWDDATQCLHHPSDRRLAIRVDPITRQPSLSDELARQLAGDDEAAIDEVRP